MAAPDLKDLLRKGERLIGPFLQINSPELVEIIGHTGFDFLIIDTEHGPFGTETAVSLVRAARAVDLISIIRVARNDESLISKALDTGTQGIIVPQINSLEAAQMAVKSAKFHPQGNRGACPFVRAARYSSVDYVRFYEEANRNTALILLIEGKGGIESLESILKLPGVDVALVGPVDLSHALGVPGQINHPLVEERIQGMLEAARGIGRSLGIFSYELEDAKKWLKLGFQFLAYSVDAVLFTRICQATVKELRKGDRKG